MLNEIENLLNSPDRHNLFHQICAPENLYTAWRKVRANRGVGGIDAVSIKDFEKNLQNNLTELSRNLLNNSYQPLPVRFVQVMKANGKMRELGILTIRDRVAQRAVLDSTEANFEAEMQDCNFAFRTGRNVEMAIQQVVVSRANGFWWSVEADIQDYFPSINREILLKDVQKIISDEKVLYLIELWLNAGILEETWWQTGQRKISQANAVVQEAITESFDNFAAQRYGTGNEFESLSSDFEETSELSPFEEEKLKKEGRRKAVKNLVKDGFWLAVSHRAVLARVLGTKLLGVGGLAAAGIFLTPKIIEAYRQFFHPRKGILQGSPISPVLANFYLTDFDKKFTASGHQLVRYCDDFVILCRTEDEAKTALQTARRELGKRNLKLHPEKTRILAPTDEFEFLGYRFLSNGSVEPPPTATNEMAQKIKQMSKKVSSKFKAQGSKLKVEKLKVKSWKEFFDIFGKRE
jgi:RNA-directed DNA polymerase